MELTAIWRYPVKSCAGEELTEAAVQARGLVDDRRWAIVDDGGRLGSGKTTRRFRSVDGLLHVAAVSGDGAGPFVTGPFGTLAVDDPALGPALTSTLGVDVHVAEEDAVAHHDDSPVHLVTTAGLRWLARTLPSDEPDRDLVRRFRPNLVVDAQGDGPVEDAWPAGTEVAVGEVVLRVVKPTTRCVMTTMSQPELPEDRRVLRTLGAVHDATFGVYADVVAPGTVRVGDAVSVHAPQETS